MRMCPCCGKDIVLLRLPAFGSKTDPRWRIACYLKGWDRSPWYVSSNGRERNATPHPKKRFAQRMFPRNVEEPKDPFFALE